MKFIGIHQNHNLPQIGLHLLFTHVEEREIIVSYDENLPFLIKQISILVDSEYQTYAVFECNTRCNTIEEAKECGRNFTNALISLLKQYK